MIGLTKEDWVEIYYALDTKLGKIEAGDYNGFEPTEFSYADWAKHLQSIMEKIGPDGDKMYEQIELLKGAARADEERLIKAAEKAGMVYMGCDTPDWLAERILEMTEVLEIVQSYYDIWTPEKVKAEVDRVLAGKEEVKREDSVD